MTTIDTTEIDIQLDTTEGLAEFVAFITEQYKEFLAASELHEEEVAALVPIKNGKDAYQKLRDAIAVARAELSAGEVVSIESLTEMQESYNSFSEAYLYVTEFESITPKGEDDSQRSSAGAAITPRFAIRERFEQSLDDVETARSIYAAVAEGVEETSVPYLTYQQLNQYKAQLREHLIALRKVAADDRAEIEYLHQESLEIEKGVLRVAAALEDLFPETVSEESQQPQALIRRIPKNMTSRS